MSKTPKFSLQYFSPTLAGDWWTVSVGHKVTLQVRDRNAIVPQDFVVVGWQGKGGVVYLAAVHEGKTYSEADRALVTRWAEELEMSWRPVKVKAKAA